MKRSRTKQFQLYLIVFAIFILSIGASILLSLLFISKVDALDLIFLLLFGGLYSSIFVKKMKNFHAYQLGVGEVIMEPKLIVGMITLGMAIILMMIYMYLFSNTTQLSGRTSSFLLLPIAIVNIDVSMHSSPMIILETEAIYFKNRWIAKAVITKIVTDKHNKRRVIVCLYADRYYSDSLSIVIYERFITAFNAYLPQVKIL